MLWLKMGETLKGSPHSPHCTDRTLTSRPQGQGVPRENTLTQDPQATLGRKHRTLHDLCSI